MSSTRRSLRALLAAMIFAGTCCLAKAQISGFNSGSGWTINSANATGYNSKTAPGSGTSSLPSLTSTTAQLLPNKSFSGAASSIFYGTAQTITAFKASFTYTATGGSSIGDGVAFVIQNGSSQALGNQGGNGSTAIPASFAAACDYNSATPGNDFIIDGVNPVYSATGSLDLANDQHPITVTLTYNTVMLFETITDTVTGTSYTTWKAVDINAAIGGQTAYIGFTAGSSSNATAVTISNFTFTPVTLPGIQFIPKPIVPNGWGSCVAPNGYGGDYYQQTGVYGDYYFSPAQQTVFQQSGMTLIRADLTWNNVEFSQGVYNWSYYDGLVNNLQGTGVNVMFILDYTNAIYPGNVYQQPALGGYANFAAAAAKHFQGKNVFYEIWNEPNFAYGFTGSQYSTIAIATEQAMRAANPNVTIIGPAEGELDPVWREAMLSTGGGNSLNAFSFHPYAYPPESMLTSNGYLGGFPGVASDLAAYPAQGGIPLPMMASESGIGGDTLQNQASYYTRIYLTDQLYGLVLNTAYKYQDGTPADNSPANNDYGLIYANNTPKPAYTAVKNLIGSLNGYEQVGSINTGNTNVYDSIYLKGSSMAEALWSTNSFGDAALPYIRTITTGSAEYNQKLNAVYANSQAVIAPASFTTQFAVTYPATASSGVPLGTPFQVTVQALDEYNNVTTGYNGTVHFTSTDSSAVLPADAKLTNGVGTFSVTLNTAAYEYITATDTTTPSITNAFGSVPSTPGFALSTVGPLVVNDGTSGQNTFSLTLQGGFNQSVNFSVSGLPAGVTAALSSPSLSAGGNETITLTASPTAPYSATTITVIGTGGSITQKVTFPLTVGPGSTLATGSYLAGGQYLVSPSGNCYLISQTNGTLALYKGSSPANQISSTPIWSSGASGGGGSYFTVMQTDGNLCTYAGAGPSSQGGLIWNSKTNSGNNYTLNALDNQTLAILGGTSVIWQQPTTGTSTLTLTETANSMIVNRGTNGNDTVSLGYSGGFTGTTTLSVSNVPAGVTATLSPTSFTGSGTSILTVLVPTTAAIGTTSLQVTAVSGSTTRIATIPLTIGAGTTLANRTYLTTGQYLVSPSGNCFLTAQSDGNVVLYNGSPSNPGPLIWNTGVTASGGNFFLALQIDGNLIMNPGTGPYAGTGGAIWASGTYTSLGYNYTCSVQDTKVVQILDGGTVIWQEPANASPPPQVTNSLATMAINQGTSGASTLSVTGYGGSVTLSAASLPSGVTASFAPTSVNSAGNSELTLTVSPTATVGTFPVTIQAVGGTTSTSVTFSLTIGAGTSLANNTFLASGQYITAPSADCYLISQSNGTLALYAGSGPSHQGALLWSSGATGSAGNYFTIMQTDGNLVTYPGTGPGLTNLSGALWASGTYTGSGYRLVVTDSEVIQILSGTTVIYTAGTAIPNNPPAAIDTPVMPTWGLGLLTVLLFLAAMRNKLRNTTL